jgi:hypothetical protein
LKERSGVFAHPTILGHKPRRASDVNILAAAFAFLFDLLLPQARPAIPAWSVADTRAIERLDKTK